MEIFILIGIVAFFVVGYFQNKAKNAPFEAIDRNELNASEYKEKLVLYLKESIQRSLKSLRDEDFTPTIKQNIKESIEGKTELLNKEIPLFESQYIKLKERYKFDLQEQVQASIDYCDWFYNYKRLHDPVNYELWNEDSFENQQEAAIKIQEIDKRLKLKSK